MKVDKKYYECALAHLVSHGDTDIFPYPIELKFFASDSDRIATKLSELDLNQYRPMSLIESLIPKARLGFRGAHQPYPVDTVIFTALVLSIFDSVEQGRDSAGNLRAFSYRKAPGLDPTIFVADRTYRDWMRRLLVFVFSQEYSHVIRTDISDFYARIYRHRLENILDSLSGQTQIVKKIEKFLGDWRGGQSFGLPVGCNACRLLAEAALNDTDMAIISEGIEFTRYVDDMYLFVRKDQDAYSLLAFLAQQLSVNEGLSLNNQKTRILDWDQFVSFFNEPGAEDDASREHLATEKLFWAAYGQDEIDQDALDALTLKDLQKELEELLADEFWDIGAIRVLLHAMRLVRNPNVATYIKREMPNLIPFSKDVCLLINDFLAGGVDGFDGISQQVTDLIVSERARPLEWCRAWFMDLGVRGSVTFSGADLRRLETLSGTLDVRQLHLLKWRACDRNFFRMRKTRVHELQAWAQPTFIFGARCLPREEYGHWIRGIKSRLQFPLGAEFADWCLRTYDEDPFVEPPAAT